jgi:hypothetical protein
MSVVKGLLENDFQRVSIHGRDTQCVHNHGKYLESDSTFIHKSVRLSIFRPCMFPVFNTRSLLPCCVPACSFLALFAQSGWWESYVFPSSDRELDLRSSEHETAGMSTASVCCKHVLMTDLVNSAIDYILFKALPYRLFATWVVHLHLW